MIIIDEKLTDGTRLFGWEADPPLTPFTPSFKYIFTEKKIFSEEECKEWTDYLLEQEQILLDKFITSPEGDGGSELGINSITARYGSFNTLALDFHLVEHLKTKLRDGICCLLEVSDNTAWEKTLCANSWFNVMRAGEGMAPHSHSLHNNSMYGFNLTINAIETSTSYFHPFKFVPEAFHIPNKIGYMTLFLNYIPHSVSVHKYETPRVSIAGDISSSTMRDLPDPPYNTRNLIDIGKTYNGDNELQETK